MTGAARAHYNQGWQHDDAFVADFVARHETLDMLLNVLRVAACGGEAGHQILIGARGMGKTSLLRRVAIGIGEDAMLRETFAALRFREEQYNVIALDAFWRNCGEALAEWCEANKYEAEADELDRAIETPEWRDADKAATAFLGYCARIGRRACLLVDNLDLILDNLDEKQGWSLRHVLQQPGGPIVIGAATQYLSKGADRDEAFCEFFHPLMLEPLSETELLRCMRALADRRGAAGEPVRQVLASSPERIRTLYTLTGGNPRILTLIYQLLERGETDKTLADLEALLDQVTPYYKARIEEYGSAQQRAVIDAVGLNWDPISSGALSDATGIAVTTISSLLNRLRKDGMLEQVATSGARDGYQFSERFLNIWYLMRHGTRKTRQRLKWLTKFLARLFSPEELTEMAARAQAEQSAGRGNVAFCEAIEEALQEVTAVRLIRTSLTGAGMHGNRRSMASGSTPVARDVTLADELLEQARQHFEAQRFDIALNMLDDLPRRFGASDAAALQERVVTSLLNKGVTLGMLGRSEEEIAAYDSIEARFGASEVVAFQERVATALFNKGITLGMLGHFEEAIAVYDTVRTRYGTSEVAAFQDRVAMALINKGVTLGMLGRSEEAIAAYDAVEARFGASDVAAIQEQVARALYNKGFRLGVLGRFEEAIAAYDAVEARFCASDVAALRERVAMALFNKGCTLDELGRFEEAIAAYDSVEARFGASDVAAIQEQMAKALVNKGVVLGTLGRSEEAIAAYDVVEARFGASEVTALQEQVAMALFNKGFRLGLLDRSEEEIAAYDAIEARFGASEVVALQAHVASALFNRGITLGVLGRPEEEVAAYDAIEARFGASEVAALRRPVAKALVNKAITLDALFRWEEAAAACDAVIARFSDMRETGLREQVAAALRMKGRMAINLGCYSSAETSLRRALDVEPDASASANLTWALIAQDKVGGARASRAGLTDIAAEGIALIDAGIELVQDNLGNAFDHLATALAVGLEEGTSAFFEDLIWLLRIGTDRGHGERLIAWFESSGNHDRYAPIHAALVAYVRGERFLLDVNPEVRGTAQKLFAKMSAHRKVPEESPGKRGEIRKGGGRKKRR